MVYRMLLVSRFLVLRYCKGRMLVFSECRTLEAFLFYAKHTYICMRQHVRGTVCERECVGNFEKLRQASSECAYMVPLVHDPGV